MLSQAEFETLGVGTEARPRFAISAKTGAGVKHVLEELAKFARVYFRLSEPALVTRERQREMLEGAKAALRRAIGEGAEGGKKWLRRNCGLRRRLWEGSSAELMSRTYSVPFFAISVSANSICFT